MLDQPPPDLPNHVIQGAPMHLPPPSPAETNLAMLAHLTGLIGNFISGGILGFVGPLIIWKTQNPPTPYVEFQAKQALNHHILLAIIMSVLWIMCFVLTFFCIGILLIFPIIAIYIVAIIFEIIASIEGSKGAWYRYPMNIDFVK